MRIPIYCKRSIALMGAALLLNIQPANSFLFVFVLGPGHNSVENYFIELQKKWITKINLRCAEFSTEALTTGHMLDQIGKLRKKEYTAMTTVYSFYTDSVRIERFRKDLQQLKDNITEAQGLLGQNPYARKYFTERLFQLQDEVDNAETLFKEATEKEGFLFQRSNADRNELLVESEGQLKDISLELARIQQIGRSLHLDHQLMEKWAGHKHSDE